MTLITEQHVGKTVTLKSHSGTEVTGTITDISNGFAAIGGRFLPMEEWFVSQESGTGLIKTESTDQSGELLLG